MKPSSKISGGERRDSIIRAARNVFASKGFNGTTTRELAQAAGVSEALIFRHFPTKEALYSAIVTSVFDGERTRFRERFESLTPSTATLVVLVYELVQWLLDRKQDVEHYPFFRLIIRSLLDEGEFTRAAIQAGPARWVNKVAESIDVARSTGDMLDAPAKPGLTGWLVHHLITGIMLHNLPGEAVIDYGVSQAELVREVVQFSLRGIGLKEEAFQRCWKEIVSNREAASEGRPGS